MLYAVGGELDGILYRTDEPIVWCLKHGGEVYDAIHHRSMGNAPLWIRAAWSAQEQLPRVRGLYHNRVHQVGRPTRPATPKRSWPR